MDVAHKSPVGLYDSPERWLQRALLSQRVIFAGPKLLRPLSASRPNNLFFASAVLPSIASAAFFAILRQFNCTHWVSIGCVPDPEQS
ncbi:hypothetical protein T440DRAFT_467617 [Plenodomus tracheiphilus IPT5]|uniref:Uncharacterized protein n=1 Tax=Plenodomus tracheiphilus IPT5 TaxID=1408161 RepID=A0A6A7B7N5_9PLEO|nr:hypothetical protein T440DRAFT_467617 [Plenodomus tracheiphilus IPT5]